MFAVLDAPLEISRWRVIGNPVMALPQVLVLTVVTVIVVYGLYVVFVLNLLFALFVGIRIPRNVTGLIAGIQRQQWRVATFALFLHEQYPPSRLKTGDTDPGDAPARVTFLLSDSSWSPGRTLASLFRIILVIPQILFGVAVLPWLCVAMVSAFFAVLLTGRWPVRLRRFVLGILFWEVRVNAWTFHLATGYPPFRVG